MDAIARDQEIAFNLAVVMGMVPPKGLVLPFISYGASAMLANLWAVGVLLSIAAEGNEVERLEASNTTCGTGVSVCDTASSRWVLSESGSCQVAIGAEVVLDADDARPAFFSNALMNALSSALIVELGLAEVRLFREDAPHPVARRVHCRLRCRFLPIGC